MSKKESWPLQIKIPVVVPDHLSDLDNRVEALVKAEKKRITARHENGRCYKFYRLAIPSYRDDCCHCLEVIHESCPIPKTPHRCGFGTLIFNIDETKANEYIKSHGRA